jgi:FMN hydrolase / 5-amino-6-(5-phospho-D-ribitylamino)uracil phosphatase
VTRAVVSFDLDGTLWEFEPMMEGALAAMIERLGERRPDLAGKLTVAALHEHRRAVGDEGEGTLEELRRLSLRRALTALDAADDDLAEWMAEELLAARADCVTVHDDVMPAVQELRAAGFLVGAITNGNFPIGRIELGRRFEFVVHAEQTGALKPAPEPFARAVELTGADPRWWVHVGDDPHIDVAGAQAFGMRAVWLNRLGAPAPDGIEPDAEVRSLHSFRAVVERLLP